MSNTDNKPMQKKWVVTEEENPTVRPLADQIARELSISPVIARLLVNRGCTDAASAASFIRMDTELLGDPMRLADIREAVDRLRRAIASHERIAIYGDYDVDGVTAVCTLYLYLKSKGASVRYYIPNRVGEGYGVSASAIEALAKEGVSLIVTVDTGITAVAEVEYAKTIGVDFVITDHHECPGDLPEACAVVNPHRPDCPYPFKELAGVGVVFKLLCAYESLDSGDDMVSCVRRICSDYADLISIGTIADVMPVKEENKLIISYGLRMIEEKPRLGLAALMESAAVRPDGTNTRKPRTPKITSSYIGFTIAPRINAAGRIGSASLAVELFLTDDPIHAKYIADELCEMNRNRQAEENRIVDEAYERLDEEGYDQEKEPVIILSDDTWHHGVIGIVASRLTERYNAPSILISFEGCDPDCHLGTDIGKGSGRSVKGLNLVDALVHCRDRLVKYGGHELAAGLSVTRGELENFKEEINAYAREQLKNADNTPTLEADCVLCMDDLTMQLAEDIHMLEPYGPGNPTPTFILRDCHVLECTAVSAGKHTRFVVGSGDKSITAMYFSCSSAQLNIYPGDNVDICFNIDINEYAGRRNVQLILKGIRVSEKSKNDDAAEREKFERIWAGEAFSPEDNIIPDREDFAAVYTMIRHTLRIGDELLSHRAILAKLRSVGNTSVGYIKLKIIIRVLQELNLLGIVEVQPEVYQFRLNNNRANLEKSNLLRKLRAQMKQV